MRKSKNPSKQLLWFWMNDLFKKSKNYNIGIDVACGEMKMCKYFKTREYIGIDIDKARIERGLQKYPKAKGVVKSIEEIDNREKGDFVVCLQTIGINRYFKPENTYIAVNNLINATNKNGMLIFNIGPITQKYSDKIYELLSNNYSHVKVKEYGSFSNVTHRYLSFIFAILMRYIPLIRKNKKNKRHLYIAKNKIANVDEIVKNHLILSI